MVELSGNTYPVRSQLKALGGRPVKRGTGWVWLVPDHQAEQARAIIASAGPAKPKGCGTFRRRACQTCGSGINYGVYCGKCEYGR